MSFFSNVTAEIPKQFYSVEHDAPFQNCLICNGALGSASDQPYLIEKIYRGNEVIVEMAICAQCLLNMQNEISEESALTLQKEFQQKVDWEARFSQLLPHDDTEHVHPEKWLDRCVLQDTEREQCKNYQICGLFLGDQILLGQLPYLISGSAVESLGKLLSKKTRDHMGDFISDQFGMPPEFCSPEGPVPVLF